LASASKAGTATHSACFQGRFISDALLQLSDKDPVLLDEVGAKPLVQLFDDL
jgi:hypothetical protein